MQFLEIRNRAAFLSKQAGWDAASPAADFAALVNRGLQDVAWDTEWFEDETSITTVANQAIYTVDPASPGRMFITIKSVAWQTQTSSPRALLQTSEIDETIADALWWQRAAGTPSRYLTPAANQIRLVAKPAASGDTVGIRGTREPPALVNDTDVPGFPPTWHEAAALRAAVLFCEPWASGDGADRVQLYRTQYAGMVKALNAFLATSRYPRMARTIEAPQRRRIYTSTGGRNPAAGKGERR